jgi:hypothetical protein
MEKYKGSLTTTFVVTLLPSRGELTTGVLALTLTISGGDFA